MTLEATRRTLSALVFVSLLASGCHSYGIGASVVNGDPSYSSTDLYDVTINQAAFPMTFPKSVGATRSSNTVTCSPCTSRTITWSGISTRAFAISSMSCFISTLPHIV